jgi:hypothetical protein
LRRQSAPVLSGWYWPREAAHPSAAHAVEKNQVVFHDVAFIEVKPHMLTKNWTDWIDYWAADIFGNDTMKIVGVTV